MARWIIAGIFAALPLAAFAQSKADEQFKAAGVCARCHVISVVEWGMSGHGKAGTTCVACHGTSRGHVIDERDNVKPERIPHEAAIAGLCITCHQAGCTKTKRTDACQSCHHVHALVDPKKPAAVKDDHFDNATAAWQRASLHMAEGERLSKLQQWSKARDEYRAVLKEKPGDPHALARVRLCERRLNPAIPGFEPAGSNWDGESGLPLEVRVAGRGIAMNLVPGGQFEMGSERYKGTLPVHTVRIEPFYLGKFEVTQAEWKELMGSNPSAHQGREFPNADRMPVERVSWEDAQRFVKKLNDVVPGGGFRLPTEAEWEFAARFGEPPAGDALAKSAWFDAPQNAFAPLPAGSREPNKLGLFDMQGNVWEWCSSLNRPYPYDAADGRESGSESGLRILRGGGYADTADLIDPAFRHAERAKTQLPWNGLRIARTAPAQQ